jgi:predicted permease
MNDINFLRKLWRSIAPRRHSDVEEEFRSTLDDYQQDLIRQGLSPEEARRKARIDFGQPATQNETYRTAIGLRAFDELRGDIRYGSRALRRNPGFAVVAILSLALGIGANVIVFGVIDALFFRSGAIPNSAQLSFIQHREDGWVTESFPVYRDLRARNRTFSEIGAYRFTQVGLTVHGHTEPRWDLEATGSYFDALHVTPLLGRFFRDSDDTHGPNGSPYAVLSYATWKSDFNAAPNIIGRTIHVSQQPFVVLGVARPEFHGTERFLAPALWTDIWNEQQVEGYNFLDARMNQGTWIMGRRRPGVAVAQARADLNRIAQELAREYPTTDTNNIFRLTPVGFLGAVFGGPLRSFLTALMFLAALVLLAACVNLGGLYAARASDRTREFAIRSALGATRVRIARQLIIESLAISFIGGIFGLSVAQLALHAISTYRPPFDFPVAVAVDPGAIVFLFAFVVSILAGLFCALAPARQAVGADVLNAIKSSGAIASFGRRLALRDLLLLVEVTLCCILVTSAFVSLRGLTRSLHAPLGFEPAPVTILSVNFNLARYHDDTALPAQRRILDAVAALPGVSSTALASSIPLDLIGGSTTGIYHEGKDPIDQRHTLFAAQYYSISPRYFETAGTHLLAGRDFSWHDDKQSPFIAVVNQTFASRLYHIPNALGRVFRDNSGRNYTIIGIVENGKYQSLTEEPMAAVFYSTAQNPDTSANLLVRTAASATLARPRLAAALTSIVQSVDPNLPISQIAPWQQVIAPVLFPARAATIALGILGLLALSLAITGIFGLASYSVARRMRDFGIRLALGASRHSILNIALGRVIIIVFAGCSLGLVLGLASTRILAAIVYGASASDPIVLIGVVGTMLATGILSASLPARRAFRINPASLLREE